MKRIEQNNIRFAEAERRVLAYMRAFPGFVVNIETAMPDIHKRRAVQEFGVAYDEVTPEQRRAAKALNFDRMKERKGIRNKDSSFGVCLWSGKSILFIL